MLPPPLSNCRAYIEEEEEGGGHLASKDELFSKKMKFELVPNASENSKFVEILQMSFICCLQHSSITHYGHGASPLIQKKALMGVGKSQQVPPALHD